MQKRANMGIKELANGTFKQPVVMLELTAKDTKLKKYPDKKTHARKVLART